MPRFDPVMSATLFACAMIIGLLLTRRRPAPRGFMFSDRPVGYNQFSTACAHHEYQIRAVPHERTAESSEDHGNRRRAVQPKGLHWMFYGGHRHGFWLGKGHSLQPFLHKRRVSAPRFRLCVERYE